MKIKLHLYLILLVSMFTMEAQNVAINDDSSSPDATAMLHVQSTTKGLLVPRMTTTQRTAISSPAVGLLVFDTDTESFWFNEASGWSQLIDGNVTSLSDDDADTKVQVEESADEDIIRFDLAGTEKWVMQGNRFEPMNTGFSLFLGEGAGLSDDLSNNSNTFLGYHAGFVNTTGSNNTGSGYNGLAANLGGSSNAAYGFQALQSNTSGNFNTALGAQALESNLTGDYNVAIGYDALSSVLFGDFNVAIGNNALSNFLGSNNVAIGRQSQISATGDQNTSVGALALLGNTNGSNNTAVGYAAGTTVTTSTQCTFVGRLANQTGAAGLISNSTALGNSANADASNQITLGNTSVTDVRAYAPYDDLSDGRFKRDIFENVPGLEFVLKLRPITYEMDVNKLNRFIGAPEAEEREERMTGFIAQEVEEAAKLIGYDFSGVVAPEEKYQHYGLRYSQFVVPLVKAVQEQQVQIELLLKQVERLEKENRIYTSLGKNSKQ